MASALNSGSLGGALGVGFRVKGLGVPRRIRSGSLIFRIPNKRPPFGELKRPGGGGWGGLRLSVGFGVRSYNTQGHESARDTHMFKRV